MAVRAAGFLRISGKLFRVFGACRVFGAGCTQRDGVGFVLIIGLGDWYELTEFICDRQQVLSLLGTMNELASTACYALAEQSEVSPTFDFGAMLYQLNDSPIMPLGGANPTMLLRELCGT